MKKLSQAAIVLAIVSMVLAVISRLAIKPLMTIEANAMLRFAAVCLLLSIAVSLCDKK